MADENEDLTTDEKKHTLSGILSVVLASIGLIMLMIIRPMGITATDETGFSVTFVVYLFISMSFAIVGGFFGAMGVAEENAKKALPVSGIVIAVIFTIILGFIIFTSLSVGGE